METFHGVRFAKKVVTSVLYEVDVNFIPLPFLRILYVVKSRKISFDLHLAEEYQLYFDIMITTLMKKIYTKI